MSRPTEDPVASAVASEKSAASETVVVVARVLRVLPNEMFLVELPDGRQARVHAAGRMRAKLVRALPGESLRVELSPFDSTKGRILDRVGAP